MNWPKQNTLFHISCKQTAAQLIKQKPRESANELVIKIQLLQLFPEMNAINTPQLITGPT